MAADEATGRPLRLSAQYTWPCGAAAGNAVANMTVPNGFRGCVLRAAEGERMAVASDEATGWPLEDIGSVNVATRMSWDDVVYERVRGIRESKWELPPLARPKDSRGGRCLLGRNRSDGRVGMLLRSTRRDEGGCGDASAASFAQGNVSGSRRAGQGHWTVMGRSLYFFDFLLFCFFSPDNAPGPPLTFRAKSLFTRTYQFSHFGLANQRRYTLPQHFFYDQHVLAQKQSQRCPSCASLQ